MYQTQAQEAPPSSGGTDEAAPGAQGTTGQADEVVEADYEIVDEEK
jgi:hypothetical protein